MFNLIVIFFLVFAVIFFVLWFFYRRYRSFDSKIAAELQQQNLIFKSSIAPPLLSKSPFKNFELYDYHPSTQVMGINGEEVFRRIVFFVDQNGNEYKSWVEIQTRAFRFHALKWELDLSDVKP